MHINTTEYFYNRPGAYNMQAFLRQQLYFLPELSYAQCPNLCLNSGPCLNLGTHILFRNLHAYNFRHCVDIQNNSCDLCANARDFHTKIASLNLHKKMQFSKSMKLECTCIATIIMHKLC